MHCNLFGSIWSMFSYNTLLHCFLSCISKYIKSMFLFYAFEQFIIIIDLLLFFIHVYPFYLSFLIQFLCEIMWYSFICICIHILLLRRLILIRNVMFFVAKNILRFFYILNVIQQRIHVLRVKQKLLKLEGSYFSFAPKPKFTCFHCNHHQLC